jgi:hypothetical protein
MSIKKLVVKEFTVTEKSEQLAVGERYSYFYDPETGKYYRPTEGFTVNGENLEDMFVEAH